MKTLTLNIGLNTNDGGCVPLHLAFVALSNRFEIIDSRVDTSGVEETIVAIIKLSDAKLYTGVLREETPADLTDRLHTLCHTLKQDCIAVFDGENGELIGPNAAEWGQFNPEFFVQF